MPLIRIETNQQLDAQQRQSLCQALSRTAAEVIGKPEQYVQAIVSHDLPVMLHGGKPGPAAFVDVRSIGGLTPKVNGQLAERICSLLADLGIPGPRTYLNFVDVAATGWGHDGATFG
jgi:phenylpyruvate tautomerase PptA (4-oxalocrotonate tautomerase family)